MIGSGEDYRMIHQRVSDAIEMAAVADRYQMAYQMEPLGRIR
jgi:hypothetical protein